MRVGENGRTSQMMQPRIRSDMIFVAVGVHDHLHRQICQGRNRLPDRVGAPAVDQQPVNPVSRREVQASSEHTSGQSKTADTINLLALQHRVHRLVNFAVTLLLTSNRRRRNRGIQTNTILSTSTFAVSYSTVLKSTVSASDVQPDRGLRNCKGVGVLPAHGRIRMQST
jgi:hypothetical protein